MAYDDSLDIGFVTALVKGKDVSIVRDYEIKEDMLFDEGQRMFKFIVWYARRHGKTPTMKTVLRRTRLTGEVEIPKRTDEIKVLAEEIRSRHLANALTGEMREVTKLLREDEPEKAAARFHQSTAAIRNAGSLKHKEIINVTDPKRIKKRRDNYLERERLKGKPTGIPSIWPSLDAETLGWKGKELWVFAAREKMGKTFLLEALAIKAWTEGIPVLFFEPEMPPEQIEERFDSLAGHFAFGKLRKGKLGVFTRKKYFRWLKKLRNKTPFHIVDITQVSSVEEIADLAVQLNVGAVFVDGIYILAELASKEKQMWERNVDTVKRMKRAAAEMNVPWLGATQLAVSAKKDASTATSDDLAYAKYLAQWVDGLFGFFADKDMQKNGWRKLHTMGGRNIEPIDLLIKWDFDHMDFSEIGIIRGNEVKVHKDPAVITADDESDTKVEETIKLKKGKASKESKDEPKTKAKVPTAGKIPF